MTGIPGRSLACALLLFAALRPTVAQRADGQYWPCNPMVNATGCPPNPGLPDSTYSIDFTNLQSPSPNWTLSNFATVNYGRDGAEFTFAKRYDSPQLWTNFYIFFGRVDVLMKCAPGMGIISSAVLMSDDFDEIDWEWSGNNFASLGSKGLVQNNYFAKGITGNYDRGLFVNISSPQTQWHTYTTEWSPTAVTWSIDGVVVRTFRAADADTTTHQFPQTPSKFQLGLWDGGDPAENSGTVYWAGGYTDFSKAPFTMYVKSVKITNANPAYAYKYTDKSGRWQSINKIQDPNWNAAALASASKAGVTTTSAASSPVLKNTAATTSFTSAAIAVTVQLSTSLAVSAPPSATEGPAYGSVSSVSSQASSSAAPPTSSASVSASSAPAPAPSSANSDPAPPVATSQPAPTSAPAPVPPSSSAALSSSSASMSSVKSSALSSMLSAAPAPQPSATATTGNQLCEAAQTNRFSFFNLFNLIPFLGGNYRGFNIQCNVDYPGFDIDVSKVADFTSCVHTCDDYQGSKSCDACAFLPDTKQCYIKNFQWGMPRAVTPQKQKTYCALSKSYTSKANRYRKRSAHLKRHAKGSIHRRR